MCTDTTNISHCHTTNAMTENWQNRTLVFLANIQGTRFKTQFLVLFHCQQIILKTLLLLLSVECRV